MRRKFCLLKFFFCLFCIGFFLPACQTISRRNEEMNLPPRTVIFCFDDGPNALGDTTGRLLDILSQNEVRAVFALLGENAQEYPDLVKRIHDEKHVIVNHGYSGKWAIRMNGDEFRDNIERGEAAITDALGKELYPKMYQMHGGFYRSLHEKIAGEAAYTMIAVSVRVYDAVARGKDIDREVRQVIRKVDKQNGGIILLHDGRDSYRLMKEELEKNPHGSFDRSWIPAAVEEIIIVLKSKGYNLDSTDYLPACLSANRSFKRGFRRYLGII